MKFTRRLAVLTLAQGLMLASACPGLLAATLEDNYPSRPVKIIVPSGPGGGYDFVARVVSPKLGEAFGQSFVVENRAGAGTTIGTLAAATAPSDGYTLLLGGISNIVFNAALYKSLPYDPADFVPIALIAKYPYTMVASNSLPQKSLSDLIAYARANPGKLSIATVGKGTGQQVLASMLASMSGAKLLQVPYKSAQAVYTDLIAGRVDVFIDSTAGARPHLDSGRVKGIVSVSAQRTAAFPNLPSAAEAGLPGFEMDGWLGLFAPKNTPKPIVNKLRAAVMEALNDEPTRQRLEGNGAQIYNLSQPETEKFVRSEYTRWTSFIRRAGITVE